MGRRGWQKFSYRTRFLAYAERAIRGWSARAFRSLRQSRTDIYFTRRSRPKANPSLQYSDGASSSPPTRTSELRSVHSPHHRFDPGRLFSARPLSEKVQKGSIGALFVLLSGLRHHHCYFCLGRALPKQSEEKFRIGSESIGSAPLAPLALP